VSQYVSNCVISGPIRLPDYTPDVHFNGMSFNFQIGMMFHVAEETPPMPRPPTPVHDL
jgi:hypothetical protein